VLNAVPRPAVPVELTPPPALPAAPSCSSSSPHGGSFGGLLESGTHRRPTIL